MAQKIKLLAPGIFDEKGGIQVFTAFLLRALKERGKLDSPIEVYLLDDKEAKNEEGVNFHTFGDSRYRILRKIRLGAKLFISEIRNPSSLIISTHLNFGPLLRAISFFLQTSRYWLVAHGVDAWRLSSLRLWGLKGASAVLSVSPFTTSKIREHRGSSLIKTIDFPNTFSEECYFPKDKDPILLAKFEIPLDAKVILTVGRLSSKEKYKGHDAIIEALRAVQKDVPKVRYMVVGTGDDEKRLKETALRCKVQDIVHFCGFIPDEMLPKIYNLCDVFAMPSRGEGFGIVYLEALASGKPCLASLVDGGQDALLGGELGTLVSLDNKSDLPKALTKALLTSDKEGALRRREKVLEHFGFKAFSARLNAALDEAIGKAR